MRVVVSGSTDQQVIASSASEIILTNAADEDIATVGPLEIVIAATTHQDVTFATTIGRTVVPARATALQVIIAISSQQYIEAFATKQVIVVGTSIQYIVAIAAFELIPAGTADERIISASASQCVVPSTAIDLGTDQVISIDFGVVVAVAQHDDYVLNCGWCEIEVELLLDSILVELPFDVNDLTRISIAL